MIQNEVHIRGVHDNIKFWVHAALKKKQKKTNDVQVVWAVTLNLTYKYVKSIMCYYNSYIHYLAADTYA